ncbi:roadblock/LC7 domain-containing protein [Phytomonospora endophytica]|uniref:Putative regulator of Ras-like GTPase activity (Roadblock/LC7/MglB family) n=1 Tax=Phytomonospora endophytica TaxID=714109 RepID=A0A841FMD4_9ACTN|nr:roadblock/LC7 domain-containing protein [Phytomonospora endophytica]MBB6037296.1 putative regulator of Ras-like GTPase activity (Roadblock/LC7/MglB family) [Phytomonospora endophytica]GIG69960.1 dynein regulation protein LC7 [Phytomonospora endophytica]
MTELDLDFLLNDFVARVPDVTHTLAVSADGLLIARNNALGEDDADRLAAVASGLVSLLHSASKSLQAGRVISNLTEMDGGYLSTMSVSSGACLVALISRDGDLGQVGHELTKLINQVGPALTPGARPTLLPHQSAPTP